MPITHLGHAEQSVENGMGSTNDEQECLECTECYQLVIVTGLVGSSECRGVGSLLISGVLDVDLAVAMGNHSGAKACSVGILSLG